MKIVHLETRLPYYIDFQRGKGEERITCPVCSETRKKKHVKCFSWNHEKEAGFCSHCQAKFVAFTEQVDKYVKPEWKNNTELSDNVCKWFEQRGITQFTLRRMNVTESKEFMPQVGKEVNTIQFNYFRNGELVNVKYRDALKNFKLHSGAELIVYNYDNVKDSDEIIICEGEIDALSIYGCGLTNVISVPNGAGKGVINLQYIDNCIELFKENTKIILATDNDSPGINLRNELASRLGIENCRRVDFKDCKDANEFMIKYGAPVLFEAITHAKPFPIEGAFSINDFNGEIDNLYRNGLQPAMQLGMPVTDEHISFDFGRLYTWTGVPGHGKSEAVDQVCVRLNAIHGLKVAYFSPENLPLQLHASKIIEKLCGKRFNSQSLHKSEFEQIKDYYKDNFYHILPNDNFEFDNILSTARGLIKQKGVKILVIDPYNTVEHKRNGAESEHEYVSRFLDILRNFAKRNNIMIFLVAHPRKMQRIANGYEVPTMYDISGSSNFYNKTDFGICVYRNNSTQLTEIHIQKVKFKHLGKTGIVSWQWEYENGRYQERVEGMPYLVNRDNLIFKTEYAETKEIENINLRIEIDGTHVFDNPQIESEVPF